MPNCRQVAELKSMQFKLTLLEELCIHVCSMHAHGYIWILYVCVWLSALFKHFRFHACMGERKFAEAKCCSLLPNHLLLLSTEVFPPSQGIFPQKIAFSHTQWYALVLVSIHPSIRFTHGALIKPGPIEYYAFPVLFMWYDICSVHTVYILLRVQGSLCESVIASLLLVSYSLSVDIGVCPLGCLLIKLSLHFLSLFLLIVSFFITL